MPFDLDSRPDRDALDLDPLPRVSETVQGLLACINELGETELRGLELIARRLLAGQRRFGRFDLRTDRRDFRAEAAEEAADGLVYAAVALLRDRR